MSPDRNRIPTGDEFEKSARPAKRSWLLRFFKRESKFRVRPGVGEAKTVSAPPHRVVSPDESASTEPVVFPDESASTEPVVFPQEDHIEETPDEAADTQPVRQIRIPSEVRRRRGRATDSTNSEEGEGEWVPE